MPQASAPSILAFPQNPRPKKRAIYNYDPNSDSRPDFNTSWPLDPALGKGDRESPTERSYPRDSSSPIRQVSATPMAPSRNGPEFVTHWTQEIPDLTSRNFTPSAPKGNRQSSSGPRSRHVVDQAGTDKQIFREFNFPMPQTEGMENVSSVLEAGNLMKNGWYKRN